MCNDSQHFCTVGIDIRLLLFQYWVTAQYQSVKNHSTSVKPMATGQPSHKIMKFTINVLQPSM